MDGYTPEDIRTIESKHSVAQSQAKNLMIVKKQITIISKNK